MFRSATFKLTMWYIALVMTISLIFSVVLYNVTTSELARGLHHESQRISTQFPVFDNSQFLKPTSDLDSSSHRIFWRLVGFNLVVLFGSGFAGYWLARRTLLPIEEAHEQQKRFTSDVSHELRTPLTALKMETEVTLMNPKSNLQDLKATLVSNLEEANKLESLINSLLRLTHLEAEELQQNFRPVQLTTLVAESLIQVNSRAKRHSITIINDTVAATLYGDQTSLIQLVVILLDNAIKYSSRGGSVTISGHRQSENIEITIKDKGIGISKAALDHVFDRFYRADNSRAKTDSEGFGLGLSIAKMIADIHQGSVTLSSRVNHGTTATLTLPSPELTRPTSQDLSE